MVGDFFKLLPVWSKILSLLSSGYVPGSVAERSKVSNSGSNGCEFEPRARTSVLRWPLNANFHRLSRSRCYFVELRCRWFRTKAASACPLLETIDRVYIPEDLQARHVKYVLNQIKSNLRISITLPCVRVLCV